MLKIDDCINWMGGKPPVNVKELSVEQLMVLCEEWDVMIRERYGKIQLVFDTKGRSFRQR
jgi:hypothetical protein